MGREEIIVDSLERAAAAGDPTQAIYRALFLRRPEVEELFVLDRDGSVRGSMLERAIDVILDLAEGGTVSLGVLQGECLQHEGYGVPPELFVEFFEVIRDTLRTRVGEAWTGEMEAAWTVLIAAVADRLLVEPEHSA
tara:strand:- start:91 stop:501 length:411 start_codon:yes stop_codon:yes gene_type:complete